MKRKPREPVALEKRRYLTKKRKLELMAENPICHLCGKPLGSLEDTEFDHPIALALGGKNVFNPVHRLPCHRDKTRADVKAIAKAKRIARKEAGQCRKKRKIPSRPFPKRNKQ